MNGKVVTARTEEYCVHILALIPCHALHDSLPCTSIKLELHGLHTYKSALLHTHTHTLHIPRPT